MHTKLRFSVFLIISILSPSLLAQIDTLCNGGSTSVLNGEYNVMNNIWGSGAGDQCIEVDMSAPYFKVTLSTHTGTGVKSYPAIFKGCHWNWCTTDNPMPIKIQNIESAPFTWSINDENIPGDWNAALDIWFNDVSSLGGDYNAELMIWIGYNGAVGPVGSYQSSIEIGGLTWDVAYGQTAWNVISYIITTPIDSVSLDIRDFIEDALTRGYLYTPWYLHAIEAGFEITSGGQGLTSKYFETDVIGTASPINYPPTAFTILFPGNNTTVNNLSIRFRWQTSSDPDLDNVEYLLQLVGPDRDTTVVGIFDTDRYIFDGSNYFQAGGNYTWYMEATDGKDSTVSTDQRMFTISPTVDIDHFTQVPDEFSLSQNYPNPFNPSTRISYSLKSSGKTCLSISDVLGREVAVLVNEFQSTGIHSIQFSGHDIPSGIYFYTLQTLDGIITKKMTLLK